MKPTDYNACLSDIRSLPGTTSTSTMLAHLHSHTYWNFLGCFDLAELRVVAELIRQRGVEELFFIKSLVECQACSKPLCACDEKKPSPKPQPTCPPGTQMVDNEVGSEPVCKPIPVLCPDGSKPVNGMCGKLPVIETPCTFIKHVVEKYDGGATDV